jgi:hypothetical protein
MFFHDNFENKNPRIKIDGKDFFSIRSGTIKFNEFTGTDGLSNYLFKSSHNVNKEQHFDSVPGYKPYCHQFILQENGGLLLAEYIYSDGTSDKVEEALSGNFYLVIRRIQSNKDHLFTYIPFENGLINENVDCWISFIKKKKNSDDFEKIAEDALLAYEKEYLNKKD